MKVTSIIKRENGHSVQLGECVYRFEPPDYACDVDKKAHVDVFRGVPEGYIVEDAHKEQRQQTNSNVSELPKRRGRPPKQSEPMTDDFA